MRCRPTPQRVCADIASLIRLWLNGVSCPAGRDGYRRPRRYRQATSDRGTGGVSVPHNRCLHSSAAPPGRLREPVPTHKRPTGDPWEEGEAG